MFQPNPSAQLEDFLFDSLGSGEAEDDEIEPPFKDFEDIIGDSDIILQVLDAR